jgi:hypothetical protein
MVFNLSGCGDTKSLELISSGVAQGLQNPLGQYVNIIRRFC